MNMAAAIDKRDCPMGWQASLQLSFEPRPNKTVLAHRQQRGPLAVQRPFYPEQDVCHLYILHPPGGVVGGDSLMISSEHATDSHAVITTPGATKFYRSEGLSANQVQTLTVSEGATLEWLPQENIYFPGAKVAMTTEINLQQNARLIAWEIHCLGLPANEAPFNEGEINFELKVLREQQPLLLEKMTVTAKDLTRPCGLRNNAVMATMIATGSDQALLDKVREVIAGSKALLAATLLEDCLIVRYLGQSTAQCRQLFTQIWMAIRPKVTQRLPCPPRIWAT